MSDTISESTMGDNTRTVAVTESVEPAPGASVPAMREIEGHVEEEETVEPAPPVITETPGEPDLLHMAPAPPAKKKRSKRRKKKYADYSSIRGGKPGKKRGKAGPDFYNQLQVPIQQALTEFDQNTPEKILDLCLIMDCTGSMSSWMSHCKDTLGSVIDDTIQKDPDCKVRVSFVGYRDFCDERIFAIHDFSYNSAAVKSFMNGESASGGGDAPEDIQGGLRRALDLNWSDMDDSIKLAFLCADAPCHGSQYHNERDDYPDGNPCGLVLEELVKEFSDRDILLTCYKITNSTEAMYEIIRNAYQQGAEQDGIEFIDIRGQVKSAQSRGVSLHSTEMRGAYTRSFNRTKHMQVNKRRCRKKGW